MIDEDAVLDQRFAYVLTQMTDDEIAHELTLNEGIADGLPYGFEPVFNPWQDWDELHFANGYVMFGGTKPYAEPSRRAKVWSWIKGPYWYVKFAKARAIDWLVDKGLMKIGMP